MAAKSKREMMAAKRAKTKMDPEAHQAYLKSERERYRKRKELGKIKDITKMSEREKRSQRNTWRKCKREHRRKRNEAATEATTPELLTPEPTPPRQPQENIEQAVPSHQKRAGRRKIRREEKRAYRTINKLQDKVKKLENKIKNYQRQAKKVSMPVKDDIDHIINDGGKTASPGTRAANLISSRSQAKIKRQLVFGYCLADQVASTMGKSKSTKRKRTIHKLIGQKLLRKYRLLEVARRQLRTSRSVIKKRVNSILDENAISKRRLSYVSNLVIEFYLRDDVTTPAAGKKETITQNGEKRVKRYMQDTIENLHKRFLSEHPNNVTSYAQFCRLRPFHVVAPRLSQRDTTACKLHANVDLMTKVLKENGALPSLLSLNEICAQLVCDENSYDCAYGLCQECPRNTVDSLAVMPLPELSKNVEYFEFVQKTETRKSTNGKELKLRIHQKQKIISTLGELLQKFTNTLHQLIPHQFRVKHQYNAIRMLKKSINENEAVIQCDFSENYEAKLPHEIMSMHFGGSKKQISLHTVHVTQSEAVKCYCTVSDDVRHTAPAIWAHLEPVLVELVNSGIDTINFISDGPSSQYKNRYNLFLMSNVPFDLGFKSVTWNYLESGHGKGPADGIGAAIKTAADRLVVHGTDITNADELLDAMESQTTIKMSKIDPDRMDFFKQRLAKQTISSVKKCTEIHQAVSTQKSHLIHRELSCFCADRDC